MNTFCSLRMGDCPLKKIFKLIKKKYNTPRKFSKVEKGKFPIETRDEVNGCEVTRNNINVLTL